MGISASTLQIKVPLEADMDKLKSFVPDLLAKKGWSTKTFAAKCMLAGMGQDTAYRMARGETNFNVDTLKQVAAILGVSSISEIIDFVPDGGEQ